MKTILMAAMLATASTGFAADTGNEELIALIEAQQKQIEMLQQQLDATRGTLTQLSEQVQANTQSSVEANEKAEILAENIEEQPVLSEPATKDVETVHGTLRVRHCKSSIRLGAPGANLSVAQRRGTSRCPWRGA